MTEAEIRQLALLHSYIAEMQALVTEREGMLAENETRRSQGWALAYGEKEFSEVAVRLEQLSDRMRNDI